MLKHLPKYREGLYLNYRATIKVILLAEMPAEEASAFQCFSWSSVTHLSLNKAFPLVFHSHSEFPEDHSSCGDTLPSIV
jgi:hypothetical protein